MARTIFDIGILSVLTSGAQLGVGWELGFYVAGLTTPIVTYNAPVGGVANANPMLADASGRFGQAWIEQGQTIKWVLTDANGVPVVTVDNCLIASDAPANTAALNTFLAGTAPLPLANGGTGATAPANALTNLGALALIGGTVSGNIVRLAKGVHPYFNNASMTGGQIYAQAAGADPTANPGDIVFEW